MANDRFGFGSKEKKSSPEKGTEDLKKQLKSMDSWFYTRTPEDKKEFDMDMSQHMVSSNKEFVTKMIPHHKGAIMMCKSLLMKQKTLPAKLHKLVSTIISSQHDDIILMKTLKEEYKK
jgi:uncharacterized protein (DUF305 family)